MKQQAIILATVETGGSLEIFQQCLQKLPPASYILHHHHLVLGVRQVQLLGHICSCGITMAQSISVIFRFLNSFHQVSEVFLLCDTFRGARSSQCRWIRVTFANVIFLKTWKLLEHWQPCLEKSLGDAQANSCLPPAWSIK